MRTVVFGTGYVAAAYLRSLHFLGVYPLVLSRHWINYYDVDAVRLILRAYRPDLVINAAGYSGRNVDECDRPEIKDECHRSHVALPRILAHLTKDLDQRLIHVSTGCIYDGQYPFAESDRPNFTNNYYQSCKLSAERAILDAGGKAWIFRIRMPFSWHKHHRNLLTKLATHDKILDGNNSITFVDEFCMRSIQLVDKAAPGIYHAAYQNPVRTMDIVKMLVEAGIRTKPIEPYDPQVFLNDKHVRRSETLLDSSKFEVAYGAAFGDPVVALRWCIKNYGGVGPCGRPPALSI